MPLDTNCYEAYNRDNMCLTDINETLIERVTPAGIKTSDQEHEFDVIICATGFDVITGAFDRIEFIGAGGQKLSDKWLDGPITYHGIQTAGFPNMIILAGPQGGSVLTNRPCGIEEAVDWVTLLFKHLRTNRYSRVEPT